LTSKPNERLLHYESRDGINRTAELTDEKSIIVRNLRGYLENKRLVAIV